LGRKQERWDQKIERRIGGSEHRPGDRKPDLVGLVLLVHLESFDSGKPDFERRRRCCRTAVDLAVAADRSSPDDLAGC